MQLRVDLGSRAPDFEVLSKLGKTFYGIVYQVKAKNNLFFGQ